MLTNNGKDANRECGWCKCKCKNIADASEQLVGNYVGLVCERCLDMIYEADACNDS